MPLVEDREGLGCRVELVPAFVKLLRDVEAEVRVAAAGNVAAFCKLLNQEQVCHGHHSASKSTTNSCL